MIQNVFVRNVGFGEGWVAPIGEKTWREKRLRAASPVVVKVKISSV